MAITRRQLFSRIAKAGVPAAVAVTLGTDALKAGEPIPIPNAAVGLLYDASICIGCKACVAACAEANDTPPDTRGDSLHQAPTDLNDLTRNVIKLYKPEDGSPFSFVKRQCMHCLDPACAAGCQLLESQYRFGDDIELIDLGTPALDLTHQIVGLRALILVDSVASDDPAGTLVLYRKDEILAETPGERLDPHSPALSECLLTAEMLGASPEHVLLVGIVGERYEVGLPLSESVRRSVEPAIHAVLQELRRLGYSYGKKAVADALNIWWNDSQELLSPRPVQIMDVPSFPSY